MTPSTRMRTLLLLLPTLLATAAGGAAALAFPSSSSAASQPPPARSLLLQHRPVVGRSLSPVSASGVPFALRSGATDSAAGDDGEGRSSTAAEAERQPRLAATSRPSAMDRRAALASAAAAAVAAVALPMSAPPADAATLGDALSDDLRQLGLLESRVTENLMNPPPYGLERPDVTYPDWFMGVWDVRSVCTEVQAPCGPQLFGGNATLSAARAEVGPSGALGYRSRFVRGGGGTVIADRDFNVREIAKASMGINAVVDVSLATPDRFTCLLSPAGSGGLLSVDLITLARRQESVDGSNFHCSEVVRQIVAPANAAKPQGSIPVGPPKSSGGPGRPPTLLKEIETASLYTFVGPGEVQCRQRSATFLLPSQQDPVALKLWEMSRGRPIDVRFYDVTYTKAS
eukprot:CAMPEP_0183303090 /NCGR_PEP_ID=MMETSP0160_2-20130417/8656_1 /TAXON_ID=2839 ORGANISM="Odontella Sinensis, Strain Grunow 1884" /NCGR_SAMPLE_ID=MMETSP0160_2 /ASSEMBLY_ACC=CAM_ASM_000250 /LENGTH=400 /DNA_ID=CAMNT_0025465949 /DNA_START=73 /DNA_END=1275 /DNA_ORIENTATION=-